MAQAYGARGVRFVFAYTHEAHPSDEWPHHESFEQKLRHARHMAQTYDIRRPMLVDDLAGTVHRAYGALPNMTYVLHRGRVVYRANWTAPQSLRMALDHLLWEGEQREAGQRTVPYWVEWAPGRPYDPTAFLERMRTDIGHRAVVEFIDAIEATRGRVAAEPLRRWWRETGEG